MVLQKEHCLLLSFLDYTDVMLCPISAHTGRSHESSSAVQAGTTAVN